jgi:glucose-6-phosphate 1-dehydrogenase
MNDEFDAIIGDHFRFTRIDAVLHSWQILEDILKNPNPEPDQIYVCSVP